MVSAQSASVSVSAGGGLASSIVIGTISVSNLSSPLVTVSSLPVSSIVFQPHWAPSAVSHSGMLLSYLSTSTTIYSG